MNTSSRQATRSFIDKLQPLPGATLMNSVIKEHGKQRNQKNVYRCKLTHSPRKPLAPKISSIGQIASMGV